jgi:hypothetical protein
LPGKHGLEFCEAKRAAEWIASNLSADGMKKGQAGNSRNTDG